MGRALGLVVETLLECLLVFGVGIVRAKVLCEHAATVAVEHDDGLDCVESEVHHGV